MAKGATGSMTVDIKGYFRQIDDFAKKWNLDANAVLRWQTGLYAQDLQRRTPAAKKRGGLPTKFAKVSASRYPDPVERDLRRVATPATDIAAITKLRDRFGERLEKTNRMRAVKIFAPEASASEIQRAHKQARTKHGRVPRSTERVIEIGGGRFSNVMYVPESAFRGALRVAKKRVGIEKSGWNAGMRKYGRRVPGWISRLGDGRGTVRERKRKDSLAIRMENRVPWVSRHKRLFVGAAQKRVNDLTKHAQKRLDKAAQRENLRKLV